MNEKPNFLLARVLMSVAAHGIQAGDVLEAQEATIRGLATDGAVDPHPDAVAYALEQGAPVVRSSIEMDAEAERARSDAQAAEAAELERSMQALRAAQPAEPPAPKPAAEPAPQPAEPQATQSDEAPAQASAETPAPQTTQRARRG